ncbi:HDIG domain-containing protein, partial [bacterium]|nr:HDIG domain-containing protein [bacterium]
MACGEDRGRERRSVVIDRAEALGLVQEMIPNRNLVNHCVATEVIMEALARHFELAPADVKRWSLAGLLHDLDYAET